MDRAAMDELIDRHISAEMAGDTAGAVAVFTEDVVHDVVGFPTGPAHGVAEAQGFYDYLTQNVHTERMEPLHSYYGDDFCVIEHEATGKVPGEFLGIPGNGKSVTFRLAHIWEFRDGLISRENVWLDGASIAAQLTGPDGSPS